jgi:hypothetical protein
MEYLSAFTALVNFEAFQGFADAASFCAQRSDGPV